MRRKIMSRHEKRMNDKAARNYSNDTNGKKDNNDMAAMNAKNNKADKNENGGAHDIHDEDDDDEKSVMARVIRIIRNPRQTRKAVTIIMIKVRTRTTPGATIRMRMTTKKQTVTTQPKTHLSDISR